MVRWPFYRPRLLHGLLMLGIVLVGTWLWYSNRLISSLAQAEERRLGAYAKVLGYIATHDDEQTEFLFELMIPRRGDPALFDVPSILTDSGGNVISHTLPIAPGTSPSGQQRLLDRELAAMRTQVSPGPLRIEYLPGQYNLVYFRESDVVRQLRYYPYGVLAVLAVLIAVAAGNIVIANRNSQNRLWVGLARETAHQIGTPLTGLFALIELMRERQRDPTDAELIREMERDVRHLRFIAERFARIGAAPELNPCPVQPVLEAALDYIGSRMGRQVQLSLNSQLPPGFTLPLNPMLFEWVIENLLKNALEALEGQPGTIVVRAEVRARQLMIEVEDSGKGVPRQLRQEIFRPGFTTKKRGWGLGLSLAKRIVEQYHGGHIVLKRSEPGRGATFRITLPLRGGH